MNRLLTRSPKMKRVLTGKLKMKRALNGTCKMVLALKPRSGVARRGAAAVSGAERHATPPACARRLV
jgi:hypothetical protein